MVILSLIDLASGLIKREQIQSVDRRSFCGDLRCAIQHFSSAGAQRKLKCTSGAPLI